MVIIRDNHNLVDSGQYLQLLNINEEWSKKFLHDHVDLYKKKDKDYGICSFLMELNLKSDRSKIYEDLLHKYKDKIYDADNEITIKGILVNFYIEKEEYENALKIMKELIRLYNKNLNESNIRELSILYGDLATLYSKFNKYELAVEALENSYNLDKKTVK